jgi:hypothetical protein
MSDLLLAPSLVRRGRNSCPSSARRDYKGVAS